MACSLVRKALTRPDCRYFTRCTSVKRVYSTQYTSNKAQNNEESYDSLHSQSINNPVEFWDNLGSKIPWMNQYETVLDNSNPPFSKWFVGGKLNTCFNAVDQHVLNGQADQRAIIYDSPITGRKDSITFGNLQKRVAKFAGVLSSLGVKKGDVVLIYMSMVPEALIAMLATVRIGAVHSVVFGGFAAPELATRINHCKAKVVVSTSVGIEPSRIIHYKPILDEAITLSPHKPKHCVVLQREDFKPANICPPRDIDWMESEERATPHDCVPVDALDPVYILYTSGTTGMPKGIVRPTGGHAVVLPWTMKAIYGLDKGDVWWAASDLGWIVGHSYICYAPLLNGNTTVLYEGKPVGTPDPYQFFRVIDEYKVKGMFTAPTALRVIAKEFKYNSHSFKTDSLRHLYVAGEPLDHDTRVWAKDVFGVPVLDNWWQTETGFAIAAHCPSLGMTADPPKGATGKPFMGFNLAVLNEKGKTALPGELGRIVSKLPLPPGNFSSLWQADDRFIDTYFKAFPGFYDTMDAGIIDNEGYVSVQARDDDVINVAGHRLSTIALEEVIMHHGDVIEAAVIGVPDDIKGEVPLAFYVTVDSSNTAEDKQREQIIAIVRKHIGPVAAFKLCVSVPALPKTRSGKIPRKSFADLARNKSIKIPPTIEDPSAYKSILEGLKKCGFGLTAPDPTGNHS